MNLSAEEKKTILEMREKERLQDIKEWNPKTLDSYTIEEKCAIFDALYGLAKEEMDCIIKCGDGLKDHDHWCFEAIMCLLGDHVWDSYNKLCDK